MSPLEQLLQFIISLEFRSVAKTGTTLVFLLYIIFAFIIVRQVNLMTETLMVPIVLPLKILAWVHLGLAIFAFLLTLIIF